jgi:diguanylate cyclase (GGDEF)-like protein/PAS domain S-box-containing protein
MTRDGSLFRGEEQVIAAAEGLLARGYDTLPAQGFAVLLAHYKKLHRQSMRLVKMGDRMQGQLNRLNDQLAKSEEKYRRIFETSIQGIFRATPPHVRGRFQDINPAMAVIFGFDSAERMLLEVEDIATDIFFSRQQHDAFLCTLQDQGLVKDHPLRLRRRDGKAIWVEVSARGIFDAEGRLMELEGLVADVTDRKSMLEELENLARRDGLTGLWNRRYFMELGQREVARSRREKAPLALVYFDADDFKAINDTHGHEAGDQVLRLIATLGRESLRDLDIFGRMGGEEFAVLLPGASAAGGVRVAEKLRVGLESCAVVLPTGCIGCTASFGVAACEAGGGNLDSLLQAADTAMYAAKHGGKNRICCKDPA